MSTPSKPALSVPMLDLKRQFASIREEVMEAVERVCASQHLIFGPELEGFEREAATFLGVEAVVGCASGTDAIWLALVAAGVKAGDVVITSAFSFFASASAIVRAGAKPLLLDIDPRTLNLDPRAVAERLPRVIGHLGAILPVHLYGQCADMDAFARITAEYKVPIVEDAAQAFGASWRGNRAGSLGAAAAFSFYPTKNLSAFGDGGCVSTNDAKVADRLRLLRNHGSRQRYFHEEIGWNSRLDAVQAAVLRVKLRHLEDWNRARGERAATYDRLLSNAGLLTTNGRVTLLETLPEAHHIFHQYVVRAQRRDDLRKFLGERGIGTEIYYPLPIHLQKAFDYLGFAEGDLPESERAAREVLALPIFPELTEEEQQHVVASIAEFYS